MPEKEPQDTISRMGRSLLQHGPLSDRVYLMKLDRADYPDIIPRLEGLAEKEGYSKIFAKVPDWAEDGFLSSGFRVEAEVPGYYRGEGSASFVCSYPDPSRGAEKNPGTVQTVLDAAMSKRADGCPGGLDPGLELRRMEAGDAHEMAALYDEVFATYPFPISDPVFIEDSMDSGTVFMGVTSGGRVVALASAEIDEGAAATEMTDFATVPALRGRGLASSLLAGLEEEARGMGMTTAYTIARSYSFGMNITFARADYAFGGTLVNNTNISGAVESMNVWHRRLD